MTRLEPPADFDAIVEACWARAFPATPLPPRREYTTGGTHHVILLGDDHRWEAMLRWDEAAPDAATAPALRYLAHHRPPVALPVPLAEVTLDRPRPFDRCAILRPVNGAPLWQYFEAHPSPDVQRALGAALGRFCAWLNHVPLNPALAPAVDEQSADLLARSDECLRRLTVCGLAADAAAQLFGQLVDLWHTRPSLVICHNDVYPQHVLVDEGQALGIVDWDGMALNEPIKDFTMWYEPFEGGIVYRDAYPHAWQAVCRAYRPDFPTPDEDRRLKLHALAGELSYDHDPEALHVADWLSRYGAEFGLR